MMSSRIRLPPVLLACAVAAVLVVVAGAWWMMRASPSEMAGIGGPFSLVDGAGKPFTDRDLLGKSALIYFGYTFCPDICPTTLSSVVAALDALGPDAEKVRPVFISVDPKRDTPAVIRDYVAAFSPRLVGLTGSPEAVAEAAHAYRVYYAPHRTGNGPDDYTMDHSSILYLMGPDGQFRALIRTDQSPQAMAADIRRNL
jgi:protein SCO1/2